MKSLSPFLLIATVVLSYPVCAQTDAVDATSESASEEAAPERQPYQIVITPTITRTALRDLIAGVEEDFYRRFNELNDDKHYDIVCYRHIPTGSHIWRRVCEPIFMYMARGDNASRATFLLGSTAAAGGNGARASAADYMISERELARRRSRDFEVLQELMEEFTRSDSEFREIGDVLAELKYRLENYGEL